MKISAKTIDALMPIIRAIDDQLQMEQPDRTALKLETPDPAKLKNALNAYKTLYKSSEWTGKFWIIKKFDHVLIDFDPKRAKEISFTITKVKDEEEQPLVARLAIIPSTNVGLGIPNEMTDTQVVMHLIQENPSAYLVSIPHLSEDTQKYLADPVNNPASALIITMDRRGYKYEIHGTKLRIFT